MLPEAWTGPDLLGYAIPLLVGLLVGPWLDLQHWQRAIQIHRENTSIRTSYFFGGLIFFLMLLFHGCLAAWVLGKGGVEQFAVMKSPRMALRHRQMFRFVPSMDVVTVGLDKFLYAHQLVVKYIDALPAEAKGLLPAAYYSFLASAR